MKLVAGIDGGGTSTRAILINEKGEALAIGRSGSSSIDTVSRDITKKHIGEAITNAFKEANINERELQCLYVGLGGVANNEDKNEVQELLMNIESIKINKVIVENDTRVALAGGLKGKNGLAFIVGTGSVCFGIDDYGNQWKSGGWGYKIDDPGSGYYLGREAIAYTARAYDGRAKKSKLSEEVFEKLGLKEINDISRVLYAEDFTRTKIASFAGVVLHHAEEGVEEALEIVNGGCKELALMAKAVESKLKFNGEVVITAIGGIVENSKLYRETLKKSLEEMVPNARFVEPLTTAIEGAGIMALQNLK